MPASIDEPKAMAVTVDVTDTGIIVMLPDPSNNTSWELEVLSGDRPHYRAGDATLTVGDVEVVGSKVAYEDVSIDTVDDSTTYRVTMDGTDFDYVAQAGDGEPEILAGLAALINADDNFHASVNQAGDAMRVRRADYEATAVSTAIVSGAGTFVALAGLVKAHDPSNGDVIKVIATNGSGYLALKCVAAESCKVQLSPVHANVIALR